MKTFTILFISIFLFFSFHSHSQVPLKCGLNAGFVGNALISAGNNRVIMEGDSFTFQGHFSCPDGCGFSIYHDAAQIFTIADSTCGFQTPYYRDSGYYLIYGSGGGEWGVATYTIEYAVATSINEIGNSGFSVFPNPVSDEVTVQFLKPLSANSNCFVYNTIGKLVSVFPLEKGSNNSKIPFASFEPGYYLIEVLDSDLKSKSFNKILKL